MKPRIVKPRTVKPGVVRRKQVFEDVLYANCWEDPEIDRAAFRIGKDDVVFSITSGGCNALAFLLDDPARVVALDLNPCQSHLLDLKMAAFQELEHEDLLDFLGVRARTRTHTRTHTNANAHAGRLATYRRLRPRIEPASRAFWDGEGAKLGAGILHGGRFERYVSLVRTWIVRLMGRALVERLLATGDADARRRLYDRHWDGPRWRALTDLLLSRRTLTWLFDGAFFAQIEDDEPFGRVFRARIEHALTELPVERNPFLSWCLLGGYPDDARLPVYLKPEHHETIRARLGRVERVTASCIDHFRTLEADTISRFNFTNIFEWVSPEDYEALLRETVRVATDGAVLTYRNLLVPRSRPAALAGVLRPHPRLASRLHARDLSFLYGSYVVETVRKAGVPCSV